MKPSIKRAVFTALIAALLAAFVIGCDAPMGGASGFNLPNGGGSGNGGNTPSPSKNTGTVNVTLGTSARTILPDTDVTVKEFLFIFTNSNPLKSKNILKTVNVPIDSRTTYQLDVEEGTGYTLEVYAMEEEIEGDPLSDPDPLKALKEAQKNAIAYGISASSFNVNESSGPPVVVEVNMDWLKNANDPHVKGKGFFEWEINLDHFSDATNEEERATKLSNIFGSAAMKLTNWDTGITVEIDLTKNKPGEDVKWYFLKPHGHALDPGIYDIVITFTTKQGVTAYFQNILHIYQGLTSKLELVGVTKGYFDGDPTGHLEIILYMPDAPKNVLMAVYDPVDLGSGIGFPEPEKSSITFTEDGQVGTLHLERDDDHNDDTTIHYEWYISTELNPLIPFSQGSIEDEIIISTDGIVFDDNPIYDFDTPLRGLYVIYVKSDDGYDAEFYVTFAYERED